MTALPWRPNEMQRAESCARRIATDVAATTIATATENGMRQVALIVTTLACRAHDVYGRPFPASSGAGLDTVS
jgi:hypothetical protein